MLHHLAGWIRTEGRSHLSRRRWARWIGSGWARVSYGIRIEPTWLELNHLDVPVPGLPAAFSGFRIVQLTDMHCGRQLPFSYLEEAVEQAQAQEGDMIVLTGDFIHSGFSHVNRLAALVGRLSAPQGVFAVLGNHDFSVRNALGIRRHRHLHRSVALALTKQGIRVLRNETVVIRRNDQAIHLAGVDDLWSRVCDLDLAVRGLDPAVPCVILAHNPRTIERLNGHRCDLMLSGHTHGGQIHLPGIGRPTLSKHARRYAAGLYRIGATHLYVNKGIGFGFRFRYGVRPEIAVARLLPGTSVP